MGEGCDCVSPFSWCCSCCGDIRPATHSETFADASLVKTGGALAETSSEVWEQYSLLASKHRRANSHSKKTMAIRRGIGRNSLSAWTAVAPDVPCALYSLLSADATDFRTRDAFVVTIIPFSDVFGDLNVSAAGQAIGWSIAVGWPREATWVLQVEELKGALRSLARRDVSVELGKAVPTGQSLIQCM